MTPWSPNARGLLTRPVKETITDRYKLDKKIFPVDKVNIEIIKRVEEVGKNMMFPWQWFHYPGF